MEATVRGNHKKSLPHLYWLLHIQNILGTEMWRPLLDEIMKLWVTPVIMITTYTEILGPEIWYSFPQS